MLKQMKVNYNRVKVGDILCFRFIPGGDLFKTEIKEIVGVPFEDICLQADGSIKNCMSQEVKTPETNKLCLHSTVQHTVLRQF